VFFLESTWVRPTRGFESAGGEGDDDSHTACCAGLAALKPQGLIANPVYDSDPLRGSLACRPIKSIVLTSAYRGEAA
jgi:hypothetical protein